MVGNAPTLASKSDVFRRMISDLDNRGVLVTTDHSGLFGCWQRFRMSEDGSFANIAQHVFEATACAGAEEGHTADAGQSSLDSVMAGLSLSTAAVSAPSAAAVSAAAAGSGFMRLVPP